MTKWIPITQQMPPYGLLVETKIHDHNGMRNEAILKKIGNIWFCTDGTYVYYTPTHWRYKL